jgi:transcriptional regulator with XRE-family HTH domain
MATSPAVKARRSTKKNNLIPEWGFGDRLRKARMVAGLKQEDIAVEFRVTVVAVSKWELEKSRPQDVFGTAERYSELTGVDYDWLLTGTNPGSRCSPDSSSLGSSADVFSIPLGPKSKLPAAA